VHVPGAWVELNKRKVIQSTGASKIKKLKEHTFVGEETVGFFLKEGIRSEKKIVLVFKFKSISKSPE
jgi:hypothetical protein